MAPKKTWLHRLPLPRTIKWLTILLVATIFLPLLAVQAYMGYKAYQQSAQVQRSASTDAAKATGALFEAFVRDIGRQEGALGQAIVGMADNLPQVNEFLQLRAQEYAPITTFSWVSPSGQIIASSQSQDIGVNVADRPYIQQALRTDKPILSDLLRHRITDEPMIAIARATWQRDSVAGVLVAIIDPDLLDLKIVHSREFGGMVELLDRQGSLVFRSPQIELTWDQRVSPQWRGPGFQAAQNGQEAMTEGTDPITGVLRAAARTPIGDTGWVAGADWPLADLRSRQLREVLLTVGMNVVALAGSLLAALLLSWLIRGNINTLGRYARQLGPGNGRPDVPDMHITELRSLGQTMHDIAEARDRSERRYSSLFHDNQAVMMLIEPPSGAIIDANPAAADFYGYGRDKLLTMNIGQINLLPPEQLRRRMTEAAALDKRHFQFIHILADGQRRHVEVFISPIEIEGRRVLHSIVHDVTDRFSARQRLRQATEELKRSNQDLEQFAYIASHDLQEPLRMVTSFMDLLQRRHGSSLNDEAREYISFAVDGAMRMQTLIRDLLAYSRVGTKGANPVALDLRQAADEALANLRAAIESTQAAIDIGPLPTVQADRTQLVQLLQNLLANAIKFAKPHQPPRIQVASRRHASGKWLISVRDEGIGIDPSQQQRIFQVFQRLHGRGVYEGTGIGLAICKKIVERHGGTIWVESAPDQGATFNFTLPPA